MIVANFYAAGLRGLRGEAPTVGDGVVWHIHVPRLQRQAPRAGRAPFLRQVLIPQFINSVRHPLDDSCPHDTACTSIGDADEFVPLTARSLRRRSVTMDAWSPEQLQKMQAGGNGVCNAFLKSYGIDKHTDIKEKYNSQAAEVRQQDRGVLGTLRRRAACASAPAAAKDPARATLPGVVRAARAAAAEAWLRRQAMMNARHPHIPSGPCLQCLREKVKAAVEGRPYTPPPPSSVRSSPAKLPRAGSRGAANGSGGGGGDEWGDWGGASGSQVQQPRGPWTKRPCKTRPCFAEDSGSQLGLFRERGLAASSISHGCPCLKPLLHPHIAAPSYTRQVDP